MARRTKVFLATRNSPRTARRRRRSSVDSAAVMPLYSDTSVMLARLNRCVRSATVSVFCAFFISYAPGPSTLLPGFSADGRHGAGLAGIDLNPGPHRRGQRDALHVIALAAGRLGPHP